MDLIVSHTNADFDALASMVAASLLYPAALMSLPGGADRNVREFLALHADVFPLHPPQEIPLDQVQRLIVVETQHAHRLGRFAALLDRPDVAVSLYDHHPPFHPTVHPHRATIEMCGANTTLMLRVLHTRGIAINPLQATLFALGIYEDTGSLTFSATTPEDVEEVAWLLRQGAKLDVVAAFANRTLTEAQRRLLHQLLASAEIHTIHGVQVLIATADAQGYTDELALLAHKLCDLENSDATFALFALDSEVLLVGRSSLAGVDVSSIAHIFGGGGHERAASATVRRTDLPTVKARLLDVLLREVHPRVTARLLMSYPVRTITPEMPVDEAAKLMLRYGHSGLTIVDGGQVVGTITRRDVDRARHHGLGHAPVRGYASRAVVTITPDTTLPEIERVMIEQRVGRLPVLEGGQLVGIVTRSDVLNAMHGECFTAPHTLFRGSGPPRNLWGLFRACVPRGAQITLRRISRLATARRVTVFLVGGAVRDLLIGSPTLDLDLLVEGEGIPLAEAVGRQFGGHVVVHPKFHTGKVECPDGSFIDFATARAEFYEYPAALPTAEHSSVREDLYRRDFTINAMAVQLNGHERGRLLDPFGGNCDLADGIIRVLHNLSFIEDPTRILRAVRFEARLDFRMEERTEELARHAIELEMLSRVSGDRLREELLLLLTYPHPPTAPTLPGELIYLRGLARLDELGILTALEGEWAPLSLRHAFLRLEHALTWAFSAPSLAAHLLPTAYLRLLLALSSLPPPALARLTQRLRVPKKVLSLAQQLSRIPALAQTLHTAELPPSVIEAALHAVPVPLCLLLLAYTDDQRVWARVQDYQLRLRSLPPLLTGDDLKRLGIPKGPAYTALIHRARAAQLDGEIATHDDAVQLVQRVWQE